MTNTLVDRAGAGETVMVQCLLEEKGFDLSADSPTCPPPLSRAARSWHEDVVDLLLKHGAPLDYGLRHRGIPLRCAFESGSISMVRKLLNAGASTVPDKYFLVTAAKLEHMAMLEIMLTLGGQLKVGQKLHAVHLIRQHGCESTIEFLKQRWAVRRE
jgi:ankyrin repeat protein